MKDCETYRPLLMGLLDGELDAPTAAEVNRHLIHCAACREEYESLRTSCQALERASFREPSDEALAALWRSPYSRAARMASWALALGGWLALVVFGLVAFLRDGKVDLWPKLAVAAMIIGGISLLAQVVRERMHTYQSDPYKEVDR
jgi:anti-sigma factor RsiW